MLRKFALVALIALGCAGCAGERTVEVSNARPAAAEPTRFSETEQPAPVRRDAGAIAAAGPQSQPQLQPQIQPPGVQVSLRAVQGIQVQPVATTESRPSKDDCQNNRASGQPGDCQDSDHRTHAHAHSHSDHGSHADGPDHLPDGSGLEEPSGKQRSTLPKLAEVPSGSQKRINLLFYHMRQGCPHCTYEMREIRAFQASHGDVAVEWRPAGTESAREKELLRGVSGHPIMAFYTDDGDRMLVRGETSAAELARKLAGFKKDVLLASQNGKRVNQTTGNNIVCQ